MADPQSVDDLVKGGAGGAGVLGVFFAAWRILTGSKLAELAKAIDAQGVALAKLGETLEKVRAELADVTRDLAVAQKDVITRAEFEALRTEMAVQKQLVESLQKTLDQVVHS